MKEIDFQELVRIRKEKKDAIVLDCRGADYYHWECIPGACNLRWKNVERDAPRLLPDKEALIITYCQSFLCTASVKAYEQLEKMGYRNLFEYSGGIED